MEKFSNEGLNTEHFGTQAETTDELKAEALQVAQRISHMWLDEGRRLVIERLARQGEWRPILVANSSTNETVEDGVSGVQRWFEHQLQWYEEQAQGDNEHSDEILRKGYRNVYKTLMKLEQKIDQALE